MREAIRHELAEVECTHDVRVLFSVESGSRSWGMASEDSDYDARFVYVHPVRDYLRLAPRRDTIEWRLDEVFDVTGWDLTKFLSLMRGSNPSVFEWLTSSIVYEELPCFSRVREVAPACFSPKASAFHYLGLARSNDKVLLNAESVGAKKYLYTVRALLAGRWCLEEQSPAPALVSELIEAKLPPTLGPHVDELLEAKLAGKERSKVPHIPELDAWIAAEDAEIYAQAQAAPAPKKVAWEVLDEVFLGIVGDRVDADV